MFRDFYKYSTSRVTLHPIIQHSCLLVLEYFASFYLVRLNILIMAIYAKYRCVIKFNVSVKVACIINKATNGLNTMQTSCLVTII